jgi:hypothetical protein
VKDAIDKAEKRLLENMLAENGGSFHRTAQHINKLYSSDLDKRDVLQGILEKLRKEKAASKIMQGSPISKAPGAAQGLTQPKVDGIKYLFSNPFKGKG